MSAEHFERVTNPADVFQVWQEILESRPEVVRQTVKSYAARPHGTGDIQQVEVVPRERILWSDNSTSFYGQDSDVKAIGAQVEVRPKDYDPSIDYSGAGRWFNDGDFLEIRPDRSKSFVFADFESEPGRESLELILKSMRSWTEDWYLLDSGGSFHLVIDKLVETKNLPIYYGQLIMDIAFQLAPAKSKLYGHIGKYLIENANNPKRLHLWAEDILEKFGHLDDPSETRKLVFPLDMRYIAHVVDAIAHSENSEGYLRVSDKHGSVPVLMAQQIDGQIIIYQSEKDPFNRKQPRLPGF